MLVFTYSNFKGTHYNEKNVFQLLIPYYMQYTPYHQSGLIGDKECIHLNHLSNEHTCKQHVSGTSKT